jgi:hypothetical protein
MAYMIQDFDTVLLSIAYLPPVHYFSKLIKYQNVYIEKFENYQKQSYRNRCYILSANGILALSVPVIHAGNKIFTRDIKIDNSLRWKGIHLKAIESAYSSSAFYLYYIDDILKVYNQNYQYLWDLNIALIIKILELLNLDLTLQYTESFKSVPFPFEDLTQALHPKAKYNVRENDYTLKPYYQVFEDKYGFVPNLSIIDLLFNTGPEALQWL